jgi:predicted metalloprotease with PDZ domain
MTLITKKVTLELTACITQQEVGDKLTIVEFRHDDLQGILMFKASSKAMAELQLNHLNTSKENGDPINALITSANKLAEGIKDVRESIKRK